MEDETPKMSCGNRGKDWCRAEETRAELSGQKGAWPQGQLTAMLFTAVMLYN